MSEITPEPLPQEPAPALKPPRRWRRRMTITITLLLLVYLLTAYLLMPQFWIRYARRHPALDEAPRITHTGSDLPGDPLNVALVGTETEVKNLLKAAHWFEADPLGLRSDLKIAEATVLRRPDATAPVSNLFLFGRREDLAFEKPVGTNPRQRHHVRFWRMSTPYADGRPIWIGAAIYDRRVGFSEKTGQITHKTGADIDAERGFLFHDLQQTGDLSEVFFIDDFHTVREGRNGGGDPWFTDGRLEAGVIRAN
jgi:hypothetical protein